MLSENSGKAEFARQSRFGTFVQTKPTQAKFVFEQNLPRRSGLASVETVQLIRATRLLGLAEHFVEHLRTRVFDIHVHAFGELA